MDVAMSDTREAESRSSAIMTLHCNNALNYRELQEVLVMLAGAKRRATGNPLLRRDS